MFSYYFLYIKGTEIWAKIMCYDAEYQCVQTI